MIEGIDVNKANESKECDICYYSYFLDKVFKFQPDVCNGCHDVLMMSFNFNDIAILNIQDVDFRCAINGVSKSKAMSLLENAVSIEKSKTL